MPIGVYSARREPMMMFRPRRPLLILDRSGHLGHDGRMIEKRIHGGDELYSFRHCGERCHKGKESRDASQKSVAPPNPRHLSIEKT